MTSSRSVLCATAGDRLVMRARDQGEPERDAEILEVLGGRASRAYLVRRQEDEHVSRSDPGTDACVGHFEDAG
jgi:hypothetical protein